MLDLNDLIIKKVHFDNEFYLSCDFKIPREMSSFSAKRKSEFCAGRMAAISAANELGISLKQIPKGEKGEPLWEEPIVGSITHSHGTAIAAIGLTAKYKSIGIDIEKKIDKSRTATLDKMVLTRKDKEYLKQLPDSKKLTFYQICFTAKEAFYKLIYPLAKEYFDFREASLVEIDFDKGTLVIELHSERQGLSNYLRHYTGYFQIQDNSCFVLFYLTSSDKTVNYSYENNREGSINLYTRR